MIEARRPDIVVVDKVKKKTMIIDVAISGDTEVCDKEREKIEKHSLLKNKIIRLWQNEKGCCDSYFSWSIRNYNNKVREVY